MECSTKSAMLVTTCIFVLLNRVGGQENGHPIKICDLCQNGVFFNCNLTDKLNIYTTMNCAEGCILGIEGNSFESFDNVTIMDNINKEQICVFIDASEVTTEHSIPLASEATETYEPLDDSTDGTFEERITADGSLDYQNDEAVEILKNPPVDGSENQSPPLHQELSCFVCKSSSDSRCLNMVDKLKPAVCSNASECMTLYSEGNLMRDCASPSNVMLCRNTANSSCKFCPNNECNSMPLTKEPVLSCSKCKSKDNPSCAWAQPPNTVTKCQNKVLYYLQETCMTEFDPVTQDAVRDCSFDYGVCTPEDKNCHTCSGNGCNRGNLKVQQCVQCNSELPDQIRCGYRPEGIHPTNCPQEVQLFDSKGCFVMTKGNFTIRGCKSSLKEDDLMFCQKKGKARCVLCEGDGCNIQLMPSRGWRNVPFYLLALVAGLFVTI